MSEFSLDLKWILKKRIHNSICKKYSGIWNTIKNVIIKI